MEPLNGAAGGQQSAAPTSQTGGGSPPPAPSVTPGTGGVSAAPSPGNTGGGGGIQSAGGAIRQAAMNAGLYPGGQPAPQQQQPAGPVPFAAAAGQGGGAQPFTQPGQPAPQQQFGQQAQPQQVQPLDQAGLQAMVAQNPALGAYFTQLNQQLQAQQQQRAEEQQWVNYGRQQFYQQQQAARANPPAAPAGQGQSAVPAKHPFGIPQFDKDILRTFVQGPNGDLVPGPHSPPGSLIQYQQWETARRTALENLLEDPAKALGPIIEERARALAGTVSQDVVRQQQDSSMANNYVQQNAGWLYAKGADGQVQRNFQGQPVLSPYGQLFAQKIQQLEAMGVKDTRQLQAFAEEAVMGAFAISRLNQSQAATQQAEAGRQNMLTGAAQTVPAAGPAIPGSYNPATMTPGMVGDPNDPNNQHRAGGRGIRAAFRQNAVNAGLIQPEPQFQS